VLISRNTQQVYQVYSSELHGNGDNGITAVMGTKLTVISQGWNSQLL